MDKRRWNWSRNDPPGFGNILQNPSLQFRSNGQVNALLRGAIINDALVADVSVIPQNQRLQSKLHFVRVPQFVGVLPLFRSPRFVVHGTDLEGGEQFLGEVG